MWNNVHRCFARRLVFYFSSIGEEGEVIYRERWRLIDVSRSKVRGIGFSIAPPPLPSLTDASSSSSSSNNLAHEISLMNNSRPSCRYLRICSSLPETIALVNTRPPRGLDRFQSSFRPKKCLEPIFPTKTRPSKIFRTNYDRENLRVEYYRLIFLYFSV